MAKKKNDQVELPEGVEEKISKKASKPPKPAKEKSIRESSLMKASVPGLVLAMVLMAGILFGIHVLAKQTLDAQRNAMTQLYMQHYVSVLDVYNRGTAEAANALSDEDLLAHLDEVSFDGTSRNVEKFFRGTVFAQLIPIAAGQEDGLGFALHDMAERLAAGQQVHPEISFYEKGDIKEQVVTHGRLLKNAAGEPAAVFLVGFPFKTIADSLRNFAPEAGSIELVQKIGAESAVILKSGEGQEVGALTSRTFNPGWELRFQPSEALGKPGIEANIILGLSIFAVVSIAGLLAWILMSVRREISADVEAIDSFCDNFYRHGNRQRPRLHLAEFKGLLAHLDEYGKELRAGKGVSTIASDSLGDISLAGDAAVLGDAPAPKSAAATKRTESPVGNAAPAMPVIDADIFRAYDVRGVVGKGLTKAVAQGLGRAIGSEAQARGDNTVVVGRDGRLSGPEMSAALIEGLRASGVDVIDVGMVPTPVLYFAAKTIANGSGVMVTGSHNPSDYNGFKIMVAGDTLAGDEIQALRSRMENLDFTSGMGGLRQESVAQAYIDRVSEDIALARPLTVVVDAGNGVAGAIGPRALEELGCTVIPLFCEVDGKFPNHHPDPSKPENLEDLMASVAANNADIGIAFDGDGDRIGVVTAAGKNIFADRLMMLYAKHVLTTNPGADIIFDVKCTRDLPALISSLGGRPIMSKTGHSFIKAKLKETGAALAGEMSGHIFFNDRWLGFDDAIYSAARLLEILSLENGSSDEVFAEFPENPSTPEVNIPVSDDSKFAVMEALKYSADFPDANVITLDGLRVEFPDSWGLVRASNTTPCLVARFEGKTPAALASVQDKFRTLLRGVDENLQIPF